MNAPAQADTRLIRMLATYLCRTDARQYAVPTPHLLAPRVRAIRRAAGRRDLLRNLEAAVRPAVH